MKASTMPLTMEGVMDVINPSERGSVKRHAGNNIEPVRLRLDEGEFMARVHDISIVGIGILTRQRLEPGTWLVLEPAESTRRLSPELRAEVRHVEKCDEEDYLVGCRFSKPLVAENMMAFG
jgi:PilZ domain